MFEDYWWSRRPAFDELEWVRQLMDTLSGTVDGADIRQPVRGSYPTVNIGETDEAVMVYAFLPGMAREDIDVTVEDNRLIVSGRRVAEGGDSDDKQRWHRRERYAGEFRRVIGLPKGVDRERIDASYRDGVLAIQLGRSSAHQPKRIEIKAA